MESDPLAAFIGEMLDAKKLEGLDDEVRQQLAQDLQTRLIDQIDQAIIEHMPEDKVDGLNELLDRDAPEDEVHAYVASSGVDAQGVTLETMLRFRDLYIGEQGTK